MENVFDALCSALNEPEIKELFSASEGVDLMVLIMKSVVRYVCEPSSFLTEWFTGRSCSLDRGP
jgi:hypothetical protein